MSDCCYYHNPGAWEYFCTTTANCNSHGDTCYAESNCPSGSCTTIAPTSAPWTRPFVYTACGCDDRNEICTTATAPCSSASTRDDCERLCQAATGCVSYEWSESQSSYKMSSSCIKGAPSVTAWSKGSCIPSDLQLWESPDFTNQVLPDLPACTQSDGCAGCTEDGSGAPVSGATAC